MARAGAHRPCPHSGLGGRSRRGASDGGRCPRPPGDRWRSVGGGDLLRVARLHRALGPQPARRAGLPDDGRSTTATRWASSCQPSSGSLATWSRQRCWLETSSMRNGCCASGSRSRRPACRCPGSLRWRPAAGACSMPREASSMARSLSSTLRSRCSPIRCRCRSNAREPSLPAHRSIAAPASAAQAAGTPPPHSPRSTHSALEPGAFERRRRLPEIGGRTPGGLTLSPSERVVAELAAAGRTNREIAAELVISVRTVESQLSAAYRKLEVRSRTMLREALAATAEGVSG